MGPEDEPTELTDVPASPSLADAAAAGEPTGRDDARESEEFTAKTVPPPPPTAPGRPSPEVPWGTVLGEYTVENKIGEGGMGAVFSAVHPLIGKRAAVKVLRKELCEDPITLERFVDEARVVNQIGHPNIVDVFAFGTLADGRSYFVMEWLKGESLRHRIARGALNYLEACAILKALARALEAAHEKDIIHRDLKPDNVFLVEERGELPRVKLLDFGIAKLVRADQSVSRTATGAMIGTPQYVAPEQAKGHAIDARVDIYSLGCVAFELLTGRSVFIADNAMEMVAKHLMEPPVRASTLEPGLPHELDDLVFRMLSKNRDERPTLAEICTTLDTVQRTPVSKASERAIKRDSGLSFAVTRPVEVDDVREMIHRRRRRKVLLARLGLVAAGIAMGAVAFMVVSSLQEPDVEPTRGSASMAGSASTPIAAPPPDAAPTPEAVVPVDAAAVVVPVDAAPAAAPPPEPVKRPPPKKPPVRRDPQKPPTIQIPIDDKGLIP